MYPLFTVSVVPSQVMMELGGFTVEGFQLGMQNMLPKVESTINDISAEVQKINTPTADIITKSTSYQEVKNRMSVDTDDFVDDIRKEVMAISSNTFDNNQMIGQAVKNALNGMAIYADGHLIGYLQEEKHPESIFFKDEGKISSVTFAREKFPPPISVKVFGNEIFSRFVFPPNVPLWIFVIPVPIFNTFILLLSELGTFPML